MARISWNFPDPVTDLQREILEERILSIPKRIARWIATHCPERLLPNKESAGVLDALDGWGDPQPVSSWTQWRQGPYWSSMPIVYRSKPSRPTRKPINLKSITKAHGSNGNTSSK